MLTSKEPINELVLYQTEDGHTRIDVTFQGDTVWLSQSQMAELFDKGRSTIAEHIQNAFSEGELDEKLVCRNFRHTTHHGAIEGKTQTKEVTYYNLDVIISVGYRVKSLRGTQFRIWATQRLRGSISTEVAAKKAALEFDIYRKTRMNEMVSDFDRAVKKLRTDGNKIQKPRKEKKK